MDLKESDVARGIDLIYAAGLRPEGWSNFLTHFGKMLDGSYLSIHGHDTTLNCNLGIMGEKYDPDYLKTFAEYYAPFNPWLPGMAKAPVGLAILAEEFTPQDVVLKSEFYADWLQKQENIATGVALILFRDKDRFFALCGNLRLKDQQGMQLALQRAMQIFAPHLQRAYSVQRNIRMNSAKASLDAFEATEPTAGLFVLDASARVLRTNAIAESWLRQRLIVVSRENRLRLDDRVAAEALDSALMYLGGVPKAVTREIGLRVRGRANPFVMFVYPLTGLEAADYFDWFFEAEWPRALVVIRDVATDWNVSLDAAVSVFGLTLAERRLAEFICQAGTLSDFALVRDVSTHTARSQLRAIFRKTGTSRQSELMLLLLKAGRLRKPG